jgi:hypothetical protein
MSSVDGICEELSRDRAPHAARRGFALARCGAELTFDDKDYIGRNVSILGLRTALDAFDAPFPPHRPDYGMYRPLTNFSCALDVAVWGPNPFGFHVTNVLLYLLVVWGVYGLCRLYLPSPGFALASAVLFSVHPVHCEAVDSVTGRSEVLALLFAIVSIYCFMRVLKASSASPSGKSTLASFGPGLVFLPPALLAYALASPFQGDRCRVAGCSRHPSSPSDFGPGNPFGSACSAEPPFCSPSPRC